MDIGILIDALLFIPLCLGVLLVIFLVCTISEHYQELKSGLKNPPFKLTIKQWKKFKHLKD
jgi:predicted RNA methylase